MLPFLSLSVDEDWIPPKLSPAAEGVASQIGNLLTKNKKIVMRSDHLLSPQSNTTCTIYEGKLSISRTRLMVTLREVLYELSGTQTTG